jgi:hypothetical protein
VSLAILLTHWRGWRPIYEAEHINALARQLRAYIKAPFKLWLLTDEPLEAKEVDEVAPCPKDPPGLRLRSTVNCFRRLRFFDAAYTEQFGADYLMSIDLDTLIFDDITDIVEAAMTRPLTILRGRNLDDRPNQRPYNGAMFIVKHGALQHVWDSFCPKKSPLQIATKNWIGSDQSWISMQAPGFATLGREHGFWYFGQYMAEGEGKPLRVLNFAGRDKPWSRAMKKRHEPTWQEWHKWRNAA